MFFEFDNFLEGFDWIVVDDVVNFVFVFECCSLNGECIIVISNFIFVFCYNYCIGVNIVGEYEEILNIDLMYY